MRCVRLLVIVLLLPTAALAATPTAAAVECEYKGIDETPPTGGEAGEVYVAVVGAANGLATQGVDTTCDTYAFVAGTVLRTAWNACIFLTGRPCL